MQGFCSSIPYQHDSHVEYCSMYMLYFMFVSVGISILHLFSCQYVRILQTSLMMSQTCYNVYIPWGIFFLKCKMLTVNDVNANIVSSPTFNEP